MKHPIPTEKQIDTFYEHLKEWSINLSISKSGMSEPQYKYLMYNNNDFKAKVDAYKQKRSQKQRNHEGTPLTNDQLIALGLEPAKPVTMEEHKQRIIRHTKILIQSLEDYIEILPKGLS
jgi:hypothetical protein